MRVFKDFKEVEEDIKNNAPPMVFKYRTWKDENHKNFLKEQSELRTII